MKTHLGNHSLYSCSKKIVCGAFLASCLLLSANAQVTYTFESPQFTLNENTPLLNRAPNIGSPAFRANFVSTPDANGLQISFFQPNVLLTGDVLYVPTGQEFLTISFNQPINGVSLDFATIAAGQINLFSSAGNTSQISGPLTPFPGGVLSFSSATPFTSFQLDATDTTSTQIPFAIDNMTLNVVPEPATLVLAGLGGLAALMVARRKK